MPHQTPSKLLIPPASHIEIAAQAKALLVRADCLGVLPTPIEQLYAADRVREIKVDAHELASFLARFGDAAKETITAVLSKVRGAADLKRKVIFMPQDDTPPRKLFAQAHELGHQSLKWHRIRPEYMDDDRTLSPSVSAKFEIEANVFAAHVIYQGHRFPRISRDYKPSFAAIFEIARMHGASGHATFLEFIQAHDEALAGLVYFPRSPFNQPDKVESYVLHRQVRSAAFDDRYFDASFDQRLDLDHFWALARNERRPSSGTMQITATGRTEELLWEAYFNRHCILVLVRRKPALQVIGRVLERIHLHTRFGRSAAK